MTLVAMALLGVYHGINPGMGWLFAVALGMQHGSVRGVWRAIPPIALGHALAVAVVLCLAWLAGTVVPQPTLRTGVAAALVLLGAYRLWRHRHPRFGGMQVGFCDLVTWSFLMASAHGAGLMLLPFLVGGDGEVAAAAGAAAAHGGHAAHAHAAGVDAAGPWLGAAAVGVHTLAYLVVMAVVAWVVYEKLGLALLRTTWINLDWLWAAALVITGVVVLIV